MAEGRRRHLAITILRFGAAHSLGGSVAGRLSVDCFCCQRDPIRHCALVTVLALSLAIAAHRTPSPSVEARLRRWDAVPAMPARRSSPSR